MFVEKQNKSKNKTCKTTHSQKPKIKCQKVHNCDEEFPMIFKD